MVKLNKQKINVYGQHTYHMRNDSNYNKKLISELTNTLKENQWIKVSSIKYENFINRKISQPQNYGFKPQGTYYSKGGWLFHENCCNLDDEIIMINVDYKNIYRITSETHDKDTNTNSVYKKNMDNFIKTYGSKKDKYLCSRNIDMSFSFSSKKIINHQHQIKIIRERILHAIRIKHKINVYLIKNVNGTKCLKPSNIRIKHIVDLLFIHYLVINGYLMIGLIN